MAERGTPVAWRRGTILAAAAVALAALLAALLPSAADGASGFVHAHRGGPLETKGGKQRPALPEETQATLRHAAESGFVVELDVKLTADGVPVVIHDASLDRTTDCAGDVIEFTRDELRSQCEVDLLGTEGNDRPMKAGDRRRAPVPTLGQALRMAKRKGANVNLEIKNIPGDPDFDASPNPAYARTVLARIKRTGFPARRLIVQSFWPPNLDAARSDPYFDRAQISYLSLASTNDAVLTAAAAADAEIISPGWPVSPAFVDRAHDLGLDVVPYTIDDAAGIRAAIAAGVDAVITNDPGLARKIHKRSR